MPCLRCLRNLIREPQDAFGMGVANGPALEVAETSGPKKENMKYCKVVSAAVTLLTRTLSQNSIRLLTSAATGRIRLLTSAATILLLATNAFAGKPAAPAAPSNLAAS